MGVLLRRGRARARLLLGGSLRPVGPSPELLGQLADMRHQIDTGAGRCEALARRIDGLAAQLEQTQAELAATQAELAATQAPLSGLGTGLRGLMERVHIHEQELRQVRRELERFGGSVLDGLAVDRRLRNLEAATGPES